MKKAISNSDSSDLLIIII